MVPPSIPDDIERVPDIPFTGDASRGLVLDLYHPRDRRAGGRRPVVVWIHGGGWRWGDKTRGVERIFGLVRSGFVGASVNYRLSNEAIFPAQLHDCKCAIRFLRAHADRYDIDPERIGAWGSSAGGHLASLLAVTGEATSLEGNRGWSKHPSRIQAACSWFGPSDLSLMDRFPPGVTPRLPSMIPESAEGRLVGGAVADRRERASLANPLRYIHPRVPPVLLMHGALDDCVPVASSEAFHAALVERGLDATLHVIEEGGHNALGWTDRHLRLAEEFFERRL